MRQISETKVAIGDTRVWSSPNRDYSEGHVILVYIQLVPEIQSPRTTNMTQGIVTFHAGIRG
jgi:hypothetical protein